LHAWKLTTTRRARPSLSRREFDGTILAILAIAQTIRASGSGVGGEAKKNAPTRLATAS
jgi:hypothetical protein